MAKPIYFGKYRAYVVDVDDPLKMGRIRVDCPKVTGGITKWCMPCVSASYDNGGDFHFPKVGEVVFIEFEDGDLNYPIYTGGWFSQNSCPLPKYDPDLRIISWGDNVIYMEKDKLTIKNGKCDVALNDKNVEIKAAEEVNISGSKNINISTDSKVLIKGEDTVNIRSEVGLSISSPDSDMTFENGEMHFTSTLGSIDVEQSGIKIVKDRAKIELDNNVVKVTGYSPTLGTDSITFTVDLIQKLKQMQ